MTIRFPSETINIVTATNPISNQPQRMLFIGQMTTGTATSGQLYQNILDDASWDTLFGRNSMLAAMIRSAKLLNNVSAVDAIPLSDAVASTPAVGSIVFTSPSIVGTISVTVGSKVNNTYVVPVTANEAIGSIAIAAAALINADTTSSVVATAPTHISSVVFSGSGLNDATSGGTYTGPSNLTYIVKIDATNTPDTFEWSSDGGSTWTTGVAITGSAQTLSNGVTVHFGATTGHTLHDQWTIIANANTLTLTAVNKGTCGNGISLGYASTIPNYTATITGMTNGATDPVLTTLFANVSNIRYQTIIYPSNYTISTLQTFLDPRWNVTNRILDGIGIMSMTGSAAGLSSTIGALNDQNIAIHCNKTISTSTLVGSAITEFDYVIAAQIGAINALRLTAGADISQYVIGGSTLGGASIASLPFGNTPMPNLPVIAVGNEWADDETSELNAAGGFALGNNPTYTSIIFGNTQTTYKTDSAGNPDPSYNYIEYVETASNVREYFWNNIRAQFAQCRLTLGDVVGNNMANAAVISAAFDSLYATLSSGNYMLTQAGESAMAFFKANKTVSLDLATGTATVFMITPIVTQLRVIYVTMKLAFNFNS